MSSSRLSTEVQASVKKNAVKFGNKAANLIELAELCKSIDNPLIKVQIPDIFPIEDGALKRHLDTYAPEWRNHWHTFVRTQGRNKTLTESAIIELQACQKLIRECFEHHEFAGLDAIKSDTLLMVRSTGEEDNDKIANPGGNESISAVKPTSTDISVAIGKVIASYFSEKSLSQRLLSGDRVTKSPFIPVLIQKMVGESDPEHMVVSGVMYAKEEMTYIDAAPGHGEMIVNSMGLFDTYGVTKGKVVHADIAEKNQRLVPAEQKTEDGTLKRSLVFKENPKTIKENPSLSPAIAREIAMVGHGIREHYGKDMDIEFVYDVYEKKLNIVQARPIPENTKQKITPSSIAPEHWLSLKDKIEASVIAPAGNAAKIITNRDQLLIKPNIELALTDYLKSSEIQDKTRAVVVENPAPSTSHQAAQFNALGIPVLQADTWSMSKLISKQNPCVIIDTQRQSIVDVSNIKDAKEMLVTGLVTSSLNPRKTLLHIDGMSKDQADIIKKYLQSKMVVIGPIYKNLLKYFEIIESAKPGSVKRDVYIALDNIASILKLLVTSTIAKPKTSPYKKIFLHGMLSIAEINLYLRDFKSQQTYLDLVSKLKAVIVNPGVEGRYSTSLKQVLGSNKLLAEHGIGSKDIKPVRLSYLTEFLKMNQLALAKKTKQDWVKFCVDCSESQDDIQSLAKILMLTKKYDIQSELINQLFVKCQENTSGDSSKTLRLLMEEVQAYSNIYDRFDFQDNLALISRWENRINDWSAVSKYPKLYQEFKLDFEKFKTKTLYDPDKKPSPIFVSLVMKQIQRFTEMMDKTIKSLKSSVEYIDDSNTLVQRFSELLHLYLDLMCQCMNYIPESQYRAWASAVLDDDDNYKDSMLNTIKGTAFEKSKLRDKDQLHPSGRFSVDSACVGTTASFKRQMSNHRDSLTLEDLFSLMHQNILASTMILARDTQLQVTRLPEELQSFVKALNSVEQPRVDLLSIEHKHPIVSLHCNIPLRNHSAKLEFQFDLQTKKLILQGNFFGHNDEDRMDAIVEAVKLDGLLLNAHIIKQPHYNSHSLTMEFSWMLNANQIPLLEQYLGRYIKHYTDLSNYHGLDSVLTDVLLRYEAITVTTENKELLKNTILAELPSMQFILIMRAQKLFESLFTVNEISKMIDDSIVYRNMSEIKSFSQFENLTVKYGYIPDFQYKPHSNFDSYLTVLMANMSATDFSKILETYKPDLSHEYLLMQGALVRGNIELIKTMLKLKVDHTRLSTHALACALTLNGEGVKEIVDYIIMPKFDHLNPDELVAVICLYGNAKLTNNTFFLQFLERSQLHIDFGKKFSDRSTVFEQILDRVSPAEYDKIFGLTAVKPDILYSINVIKRLFEKNREFALTIMKKKSEVLTLTSDDLNLIADSKQDVLLLIGDWTAEKLQAFNKEYSSLLDPRVSVILYELISTKNISLQAHSLFTPKVELRENPCKRITNNILAYMKFS